MTSKQIPRLFPEPKSSYFLFGPRRTGKSTLVTWRYPQALIIDLRIKKELLRFSTNPDLLQEWY